MLEASHIFSAQGWKYSRLASGLVLAVLVWLLGKIGVLEPLDALTYDPALRLAATVSPPPCQVVLVEARHEELVASPGKMSELVETLRGLGVKKIVLTFSPPGGTPLDGPDLVLGVEQPPLGSSAGQLQRAAALASRPSPAGSRPVAYIDPRTKGAHREQAVDVDLGGRLHPTIEAAALSKTEIDDLLGSRSRFRVFFRGGPRSLPIFDLPRLLRSEILPELLAGSFIVVGLADEHSHSSVHTPTTSTESKMSRLEFHGQSLNSLLTGMPIVTLGDATVLLLLLAAALAGGIVYQWSDASFGTWLTLFSLLALALVSVLSLLCFRVWLPLSELACNQVLLAALAARGKARQSAGSLRNIIVGSQARTKDRNVPSTLDAATDHWPLVSSLVQQTLDVSRAVFFEARPDGEVLEEICCIHCTFDEVLDRARDYRRPPYLTALELGGPLRLDRYFRTSTPQEEQFLIPLVYAGEVLGFWACSLPAVKGEGATSNEEILRDYAVLTGEVLFQHRKAISSRHLVTRLDACLTHDETSAAFGRLATVVENLHTQLRYTEELLSNLSTAVIVYDTLGRFVSANEQMLAFLHSEGFSPHKLTALDLVSSVSEYDLSKSRRLLRHVMIERQRIALPVRSSTNREARYVLCLQPVPPNSPEKERDIIEDLGRRAIVCELIDTTSFTGAFEMKQRLATRLGLQLRNDLASIDLSSSLLANPGITAATRQHISQIIHDKVAKTMDVLVECQQYLTLDCSLETLERFPVDAQASFDQAIAAVKPLLAKRNIHLDIDSPKLMSFVLAAGDDLKTVFLAVLKLLAADATDSSTLQVVISESEDAVLYLFRNMGFGIPNERFQEYLFGDLTLASEELKTLREAIGWVKAWGGHLEASSEVGIGVEVSLRLTKFL